MATITPSYLAVMANASPKQQTMISISNKQVNTAKTPTSEMATPAPALIWEYAGKGEFLASPVVADLFGNGRKEVIAASTYATYCLNGTTGSKLWNCTTGQVQSSPVVADLFGDGKLEVIVGSSDNEAHCLNGTTGSLVWGYVTDDSVVPSPVVADLLGNAKLEVLVATNGGTVYCLNATNISTIGGGSTIVLFVVSVGIVVVLLFSAVAWYVRRRRIPTGAPLGQT